MTARISRSEGVSHQMYTLLVTAPIVDRVWLPVCGTVPPAVCLFLGESPSLVDEMVQEFRVRHRQDSALAPILWRHHPLHCTVPKDRAGSYYI